MKPIKRGFSFLLSVALCFALLLQSFAFGGITLKPHYEREKPVLKLSLPIPKGSNLATFATCLQYDAEKLTLSAVEFGAGDLTTYAEETTGKVSLSAIWTEHQEAAATLVTFTFQIKEGAKGDVKFSFTDTKATDQNDKEISVSFGSAKHLQCPLEGEIPNADIPATARTYIAAGAGAVALLSVGAITAILVKKKQRS